MRIIITNLAEHLKKHTYLYIIISLIILLNIKVFVELISDWMRDDNYSHGFFIIPISIYLLYRKKDYIKLPAQNCRWGILFFIFGCLGLILGIAASEYFTTRFAIVLMLTSLTLYYVGVDNFKKIWFPFFFLLFMIPIPSTIYYSATLPMQLFASKVTYVLLKTIGVSIVREGNILRLQDYSLEVAEACSGLRSLVTLLALGALYAYTKMPGKILPVVLVIATVPIAIVTNIFRIFVTGISAYAISKELAEDFLHEISGILVFFTALFLMLILGSILVWIRDRLRS